MSDSKKKIYLDTSVPSNFYDTYPVAQIAFTRLFWSEVLPRFTVYVSPLTIKEVGYTPELSRRTKILELIKQCSILAEDQNIESIATEYIRHKLIPPKSIADAFHIAFASFHRIDYLVTWNIKHMASPENRKRIVSYNAFKGLFIPIIATPEELVKEFYEEE